MWRAPRVVHLPTPSESHRHGGLEPRTPDLSSVRGGQIFPGVVRGLARAVRCYAPPSIDPTPIGTLLSDAAVFQLPLSPSHKAASQWDCPSHRAPSARALRHQKIKLPLVPFGAYGKGVN